MIENVKLRQIIAKNNFPGIFQQKENFSENLTSHSRLALHFRDIARGLQIKHPLLMKKPKVQDHNGEKIVSKYKLEVKLCYFKHKCY